MALALIALAQHSHGQIPTLERLYHLSEVPTPHFQIQQEPPAPTPVAVPSPPVPVTEYQQEFFADFASFPSVEQVEQVEQNDGILLLDLDESLLYPPNLKQISSESQSIASLDLPMPTLNSSNYDESTSQKAIGDTLSFTSSTNNELGVAADRQSLHSVNSADHSKLGKNALHLLLHA